MSVLEDNKVIAEYLGVTLNHTGEYDYRGEHFGKPYQPNKDWNQLMEVVERIEKECLVYIWGGSCKICTTPYDIHVESNTKQQAVYQAVLEYIKSKEA